MGTQLPHGKGTAATPHFSAHVYCGQTVGWFKMSLGTEVDLGAGHINVLMETQLHSPWKGKGHGSLLQLFGPRLLWPNRWIDQGATWYQSRPRPRPHCVRWEASPPHGKEHSSPLLSVHLYRGQTAGWIKMPLIGTEVDLGPARLC